MRKIIKTGLILLLALFIGSCDSGSGSGGGPMRIKTQTEPSTSRQWVYYYNDNGSLSRTETLDTSSGELTSVNVYTNNARGQRIKEEYYNEFNSKIGEAQYEYDSDNVLTRLNEVSISDGTLLAYTHYFFDDGRKIRQERYNAPDILRSAYDFQYDRSGKRTTTTDSDGNIRTTREYDGNGRLNKIINSSDGSERQFVWENGRASFNHDDYYAF
ncbi:hypothetical protein [Breznakiella homolactica]|uniref:YD repeat-containing protein n=1 Tax=Breznakiella homolactica TaxID=2798577 RepID=A0A7T7XPF5_9SPIR|nr:hypothetical protein [Breznakiella homolactica]QQO10032.1 hypothetical protein JFL75_03710 [Breznakiella homolactica]